MGRLGAGIAAVVIIAIAAWLIRRAGNTVRRELPRNEKKH